MKNLILYLLFILAMAVFCPHPAEAAQPHNPQLLYPSSKRIVIFVADG
ncbi:MAG: hypothetical protein PHN92_07460 [Geobacter sp.]|nr:hypothetical protein [Geobacter sp.]